MCTSNSYLYFDILEKKVTTHESTITEEDGRRAKNVPSDPADLRKCTIFFF